MKQCIAMSVLGTICLFLASCNGPRDANGQPIAQLDQLPKIDEPVIDKKPPREPLASPRIFIAERNTSWRSPTENSVRINVGPNKDAVVLIELWENGKRSDRIAAVAHRLIAADGEIEIATYKSELEASTAYKIEIGDGLGRSAFFYEVPPNFSRFVIPPPEEISVNDGVAVPFLFLCIGKDCTPRKDESNQEVVRRVEHAIVLSLSENEKK